MTPIVPAIIPKSTKQIINLLPELSFSPEIHIDVVDGKFVRSVSWPYDPVGYPDEIKAYTDSFTLEVDLMVDNPLIAADSWLAAGADMLVFHVETIELPAFKRFTESAKISVGISASNDTPLSTLESYTVFADYVQLMGIAEIGVQGQMFDERVLERIISLKKKFPKLSITVDGSVNEKTITRLHAAGADRFICGSAIVASPVPHLAHTKLQKLIN